MQRRGLGLGVLALVSLGVAAISACVTEVDDPRYGPPGGLRGVTLPAPTSTTTGTGTGTSTGGGDSGAPPSDGGSTAMNCTVKFSTDIYPSMQPTGTWRCTNSTCHGSQAATPPYIDPASASNAYTALTKDTSTGKPFIATTKDPAASGFTCCLAGTCGGQMPVVGGTVGAMADATTAGKLATWLQCGAPNN